MAKNQAKLTATLLEIVLWRAGVMTRDNVVIDRRALEDALPSARRMPGVKDARMVGDELRIYVEVPAPPGAS